MKKYSGVEMKTLDISGMGSSYEAACQKMLLQGLHWLKEHPDFDFTHAYKGIKGVFGLVNAESNASKELDEAICQGVDPTGAMHHTVLSHLAYIHRNGYDNWVSDGKKNDMKVYETTEEEIDNTILIAQVEWQLKLDRGFNPAAELFSKIPPENIIEVNPDNPEDVARVAKLIAKIIKKIIKNE